jgi:hypothetical protein
MRNPQLDGSKSRNFAWMKYLLFALYIFAQAHPSNFLNRPFIGDFSLADVATLIVFALFIWGIIKGTIKIVRWWIQSHPKLTIEYVPSRPNHILIDAEWKRGRPVQVGFSYATFYKAHGEVRYAGNNQLAILGPLPYEGQKLFDATPVFSSCFFPDDEIIGVAMAESAPKKKHLYFGYRWYYSKGFPRNKRYTWWNYKKQWWQIKRKHIAV